MVKLPKDLQNKQKSKPKRPQAVKQRESSQTGSRQMRRRMQQQGIDMEQVEATRVIIEGQNKTLIIDQPEVILMKQMGQEIYQVMGDAHEASQGEEIIIEPDQDEELLFQDKVKITISENDVMLVATQANVDNEEARAVLTDCEGDIAKAILFLKNRP
ncbi:MAG: nascent polypeptide-associated complex protein [Promethearchaeota archaeon]